MPNRYQLTHRWLHLRVVVEAHRLLQKDISHMV
jgi:hypothetical protein